MDLRRSWLISCASPTGADLFSVVRLPTTVSRTYVRPFMGWHEINSIVPQC
jgi:hypothetical protein